jgi:hypothetical protein
VESNDLDGDGKPAPGTPLDICRQLASPDAGASGGAH